MANKLRECQVQKPQAELVAWAAGLFEGEGCWHLAHRSRRQHGRIYEYEAGMAVLSTTDKDVLEQFQQIVGAGRIYGPIKRDATRKDLWRWCVQDARGFWHVADLLRPWLGTRRLEKLAEVEAGIPRRPRNERLTAEEVVEIRAAPGEKGVCARLGRLYGVDASHISRIRGGKRRAEQIA